MRLPRRTSLVLVVSCFALAASACSAGPGDGAPTESGGGSAQSTGAAVDGGGGSTSASTAGDGGATFNPSGSGGSTSTACNSAPDVDGDGDGFTGADGDCNDCDPNVNPGAIEVAVASPDENGKVVEPADEDCNGKIDDVAPSCDDGIDLADTDAMNGARALGLCQQASAMDRKWGVLKAKYVRADGTLAQSFKQIGVQSAFGANVKVREGARMLMLSSGHARTPKQADACGENSCSEGGAGTAPPGFPQDVPNCDGDKSINDDIALEVKLRAPTNATGYSFDFDFYSFEYPEWVCTEYNDQFIALVSPPPMGSINGNVSFDSKSNPVSVNIAFFQVCDGCKLGTGELQGTGFGGGWGDDAGATSWLRTKVPVTGGDELTIRFAIWDTGDTAWDSSVLLDDFKWIANGGTITVGTDPDPPK